MAKSKSIEEKIEDFFKKQLDSYQVKYFTKTEPINTDIDEALKNAPSKSGGSGTNYPDIKVLIETKTMRRIPVMIEVKGTDGRFIKFDKEGNIELVTEFTSDTKTHKKGEKNYTSIEKYAVNGAVHYANAILNYGSVYNECIAIGINGYEKADGTTETEVGVYYISKDNLKGKLFSYLNKYGLDRNALSQSEKEILDRFENKKIKYSCFKIIDIFDIKNTNSIMKKRNYLWLPHYIKV